MDNMKFIKRANKVLTALFAMVFFLSFTLAGKAAVLPTDKHEPEAGNYFILYNGGYDSTSKEAILTLINNIRREACNQGVRNPNTGKPLTKADYKPAKWSRLLESKARIRAAEACFGGYEVGHNRPNGEICFSVKSNPEYDTYSENLAWNWKTEGTTLQGIKQWYEEKADWVNNNKNAVTGHYTNIINPDATVIGIAGFYTSKSQFSAVAGVTSNLGANPEATLDESKVKEVGKQTQVIEINPNFLGGDFKNITTAISGKDKIKKGESSLYKAVVTIGGYKGYGSPAVTWKFKNESDYDIADLSSTGKVTGKEFGTVTLCMTSNGTTSEKVIQIVDPNTASDFKDESGNKFSFHKKGYENVYQNKKLDKKARPYQLTVTAKSNRKMLVEWTNCKKLGADIDGYIITRKVGRSDTFVHYATVGANRNYFIDTLPKKNTNYYYMVFGYKKDKMGNITISENSMSAVGQRLDSAKINPYAPKLNYTKKTICQGESVKLRLTYPKNSISTWTRWRTHNDAVKVAKVNQQGVVTGLNKGKVLVSARTPNGRDIRCLITVVDHKHNYNIPIYSTRSVPVYSERSYCYFPLTGRKFYSESEALNYQDSLIQQGKGCSYTVLYEEYQSGTRTERYISGYKCSCGATK